MELFLQALDQVSWERATLTGLRLLLILALAWVALFALRTALRRLIRQGAAAGEVPSESAKRAGTLARLLRQAVVIAVWLMAGLVMLRELGVEIAIAYGEGVDRVIGVMQDTGASLRADAGFAPCVLEDIEVFGVETLADAGVVIKGRIKTVPNKQWEVGREFLRRLKAAFERHGVRLAPPPAPKPGAAGT